MIKPNEIRVGNYVNVIDKIDKVTGVSIRLRPDCGYYSFENFHAELKGIHLKPIPLTEDILLKCGFSRFKNDFGYKSIKWTLEDNQFNLQTDFFYLVFIEQYGKNKGKRMFEVRRWGRALVAIDYLHQLQNLYFALTNEELTINL